MLRGILWSFALLCLLVSLSPRNAFSDAAAPSNRIGAHTILYHGCVPCGEGCVDDGDHRFAVRLYDANSALVHTEELYSSINNGMYDLFIGSRTPLTVSLSTEYTVGVRIDGGNEVMNTTRLNRLKALEDGALKDAFAPREEQMYSPIDATLINAREAENRAIANGILFELAPRSMPYIQPLFSPVHGLNMEMQCAPDGLPTMDAYQMAKYGRINVEYNKIGNIDGTSVGVAAQALHVAHHLLLYSAGLTTDINNDGMFLVSMGWAHYQIGNRRDEPFVDAPFLRMKFHSSEDEVFAYSEFETTMHIRAYITTIVGIGLRVTPSVQLIGGYHHTEFNMQTEQMVRMVDGLTGIINFAM